MDIPGRTEKAKSLMWHKIRHEALGREDDATDGGTPNRRRPSDLAHATIYISTLKEIHRPYAIDGQKAAGVH